MTLAELDALITSTPGAAMILLMDGDWRATMRDPAGAAWRQDLGDRVVYRGLPVWVVSPGPSRVLTAGQMRAKGLDALTPP